MNDVILFVLTAASAYLLGSLNFALLVSKFVFHMDIREHGSGNAGATNALRVVGAKWTVPIALGDIAKGVAAVLLGSMLLGDYGRLLACLCAILGHIFPLYFGFRGGKGVITTAAIIAVVDWRVFLLCISVFLVFVLIWRYVSLGSIAAACCLPPVMWFFHPGDWKFTLTALCITAVLVFVHRGNIQRLRTHTERKLTFRKKEE